VDEESRLWLLDTTVAGGRAIASAVAGATITVAAIVFSITALTTQMASNQYSPRALGEFFEDRFQQSVIGLVVGTFTYSLLVLGSLGGWGLDESWEAIPTEAIEELATVHGEDDLDRFATFGSYTGWRTAIDEGGEWLFLVAGD